jgi:hypothetical protein
MYPALVLSGLAMMLLIFDMFVREENKHLLGWVTIATMIYCIVHILAPPM